MLVHLYRVAIKFTCINGPMILSTCSEGADSIGPGGWSQCIEGLWFHCLERGGCTYSTLWGLLVV